MQRLLRLVSLLPFFLSLLFAAGFSSAQGISIEKALMPGKVIEGHAKYELECQSCHQRFDKGAQSRLCIDCHKEIGNDVKTKSRFHGRLEDNQCRNCHTDHKGRSANIAPIDKSKFDHSQTDFRLLGAHKNAKCETCHKEKLKYRQAPKLCSECHRKDDMEKGHKGHLGSKCENCHNENKWTDTRFDHEKTKFSLEGGKHAEVKCKECHVDKTYQNTPLTCHGCHKTIDQDKGHKGRYGNKCESCHNDKGWKEIKFLHDQDTRYALKGKHRQTKCDSCHLPEKGLLYQQKLPTKCVACHKKDDQEKGHRGELGEKCDNCHNERGWKNSNFDHDETKFPLREKHKDAKCDSCHSGGVSGPNAKIKIETDCYSCHRKQDDAKGHKGRYGVKCATCHTPQGWTFSIFDHDKDTKYPLKGKHRDTKCDDCHTVDKGPLYGKTKLEQACMACHKKDDKHKGQLGEKCESCHLESRWTGVQYDHNKSRFALTGSHARVECKKCHLTPAFKDAPLTCHGCHHKDDKHKGGFGKKCDSCHTTGTWKTWDFDHATTRFKLDGAHSKVECKECHREVQGKLVKPSRTCFSCHLQDDVHNGSFGVICEICHKTDKWKSIRR